MLHNFILLVKNHFSEFIAGGKVGISKKASCVKKRVEYRV